MDFLTVFMTSLIRQKRLDFGDGRWRRTVTRDIVELDELVVAQRLQQQPGVIHGLARRRVPHPAPPMLSWQDVQRRGVEILQPKRGERRGVEILQPKRGERRIFNQPLLQIHAVAPLQRLPVEATLPDFLSPNIQAVVTTRQSQPERRRTAFAIFVLP
ncbi:hypothetical protein [Burkholderia sp. BCC0322]|uniref:hypothetical protein n=1 Tax=unclassified Burkholderia TaxID=2613784 RepID=UPI00158BF3C0|nr:hypothetical protein [Burkholderia sp. BCC0322]